MTITATAFERPPYEVLQAIDGRICPPDQVIAWQSPMLSDREHALVNHVHGVVAGHITGPDQVRIAIGLMKLGELEAMGQHANSTTDNEDERRAELDDPLFGSDVSAVSRELGDGLLELTSKLTLEQRHEEIVPAILKAFSLKTDYPDGIVDDLKAMERTRSVFRQAVREGLAFHLGFALQSTVDDLVHAKRYEGDAPDVTLEVGDDEISGRLDQLRRSTIHGSTLDVRTQDGPRRIELSSIRGLGITVTRNREEEQEVPDPEPSAPPAKPASFFRRRG